MRHGAAVEQSEIESDTYGTLKRNLAEAVHGPVVSKSLGLLEMAERQGFEPWVQVLARTTV